MARRSTPSRDFMKRLRHYSPRRCRIYIQARKSPKIPRFESSAHSYRLSYLSGQTSIFIDRSATPGAGRFELTKRCVARVTCSLSKWGLCCAIKSNFLLSNVIAGGAASDELNHFAPREASARYIVFLFLRFIFIFSIDFLRPTN